MEEKKENKPYAKIRYGTIAAAIWQREGEKGTWYNVTFSRSYKDGKDWKHTDSFGRDDLLTLAKLANEAHTRISEFLKEKVEE